jgi:hypothetical protein
MAAAKREGRGAVSHLQGIEKNDAMQVQALDAILRFIQKLTIDGQSGRDRRAIVVAAV